MSRFVLNFIFLSAAVLPFISCSQEAERPQQDALPLSEEDAQTSKPKIKVLPEAKSAVPTKPKTVYYVAVDTSKLNEGQLTDLQFAYPTTLDVARICQDTANQQMFRFECDAKEIIVTATIWDGARRRFESFVVDDSDEWKTPIAIQFLNDETDLRYEFLKKKSSKDITIEHMTRIKSRFAKPIPK